MHCICNILDSDEKSSEGSAATAESEYIADPEGEGEEEAQGEDSAEEASADSTDEGKAKEEGTKDPGQ